MLVKYLFASAGRIFFIDRYTVSVIETCEGDDREVIYVSLRRAQDRAVGQSEMDGVNSTFDQRIQRRRDGGSRISPWRANS
jgi:hypothetical protein